jgi:hypothetical protein
MGQRSALSLARGGRHLIQVTTRETTKPNGLTLVNRKPILPDKAARLLLQLSLNPPRQETSRLTEVKPVCDHTVTYSLADTQAIQTQLTQAGNGNNNDNCCNAISGDCGLLVKPSGGTSVELCGATGRAKHCAGCANIGIAMNALNIDCQNNYLVGGSVCIPYSNGVMLQLAANPST